MTQDARSEAHGIDHSLGETNAKLLHLRSDSICQATCEILSEPWHSAKCCKQPRFPKYQDTPSILPQPPQVSIPSEYILALEKILESTDNS